MRITLQRLPMATPQLDDGQRPLATAVRRELPSGRSCRGSSTGNTKASTIGRRTRINQPDDENGS